MTKYRCTKPFALDRIDDYGNKIWGAPIIIEKGMDFIKCEDDTYPEFPVVYLEGANDLWLAIHPVMLHSCFVEIK